MNYFSFHIGDYAVHTRYLSMLEDLAYRRLLDLYYTNEGPIATLDPAHEIGMAGHEAEVNSVLRKFFVEVDGEWHNVRCNEEIAAYKKMGDDGRRGAAKRWGKPVDSPPIATPIATSNQEPRTKESRARGSRLPQDLVLGDELRRFAIEQQINPDIEFAKFRDYWYAVPGQKGVKLDWPATWRNWCRNAKKNPADVARVTAPAPKQSNYLAEQAAHRAAVEADRLARKQKEAA